MSKARLRGAVPLAIFVAFIAGIAVDSWLRTYGPPKPARMLAEEVRLKPDTTGNTAIERPAVMSAPPSSSVVSGFSRTAGTPSSVVSGFSGTSGTSGEMPSGHLRMPLDGANIESLRGGFAETRGSDRPHEAVDMLAPRNTPVHAVEGGSIAKLFTSKAGGLTIYQFDPSGRLCYYYAHLERYADGLKDGQTISQGDVIGYVGTTGNAPPNTPHLHFAVFELNSDKHWWQGRAIDPYLVFKDRG
jgi:murein DD-endopeptidase MepM/ murein hydrolase activator NlpD